MKTPTTGTAALDNCRCRIVGNPEKQEFARIHTTIEETHIVYLYCLIVCSLLTFIAYF